MNEARQLIAYSFVYVRRRIQSMDEFKADTGIRLQLLAQRKFAEATERHIVKRFPDWSTYRGALFVSRAKFRDAVGMARHVGADLLLADIPELLARTRLDQIVKCADFLNSLDIEVWDAFSRRTWQSMSGDERRSLVRNAEAKNRLRSGLVKDGLLLSQTEKTATANTNYKKGNLGNRRNADQRARRLRDFVLKEIAKLRVGEKISPSALAAALNEAGIPSARGGCWTHNTAKDLIARVENLSATSPTI